MKLYINENAAWQNTLSLQSNEIPRFEKILGEALTATFNAEENMDEGLALKRQLLLQKNEMSELTVELDVQQWRLQNESKNNFIYNIQVLCSQDILKERIKHMEERYEDLKINFTKHLPANPEIIVKCSRGELLPQ